MRDMNRSVYRRSFVVAGYAKESELQPPEAAILDKYRSELAGARLLDLGVGGGRTTPALLEISRDYIGADYVPEMVERCRARFPGVRFEVLDARDLSCFSDGAFDLVLFSWNGIDTVGHDDRLKILAEVRRILKRNGLFVFSSHNRNAEFRKPWDPRHLKINPLRDPARFANRLVAYTVSIINHLEKACREVRNE